MAEGQRQYGQCVECLHYDVVGVDGCRFQPVEQQPNTALLDETDSTNRTAHGQPYRLNIHYEAADAAPQRGGL